MILALRNGKIKFLFFFLIIFLICFSIKSQETNFCDSDKFWFDKSRLLLNYSFNDFDSCNIKFNKILLEKCNTENTLYKVGILSLARTKNYQKVKKLIYENQHLINYDFCKELFLFTDTFKFLIDKCNLSENNITKPELQRQLLQMYINDQNIRNNTPYDLLKKYNIALDDILYNPDSIPTDNINNYNFIKLKSFIAKNGFPRLKEVGKDGLFSIFILTQHCDDIQFMKNVCDTLWCFVKNQEFEASHLAYLVDRINLMEGKNQIFGTQNMYFDKETNKFIIPKLEDPGKLNCRRKEIGLMPIELYEEIEKKLREQNE